MLEAASEHLETPPSWTGTDLGEHYRQYKAEETAWRLGENAGKNGMPVARSIACRATS